MAKSKAKSEAEQQKISSDDTKTLVEVSFNEVNDAFRRAWYSFDGDAGADEPMRYSKRERETIRLIIGSQVAQLLRCVAMGREKREALEARVAALEKCPISYQGTWQDGVTYPPKSFCTFGGSMWWSPVKTKARPSEGRDWVLAVKRGQLGRDAKP